MGKVSRKYPAGDGCYQCLGNIVSAHEAEVSPSATPLNLRSSARQAGGMGRCQIMFFAQTALHLVLSRLTCISQIPSPDVFVFHSTTSGCTQCAPDVAALLTGQALSSLYRKMLYSVYIA